jgi:hypothetical protein
VTNTNLFPLLGGPGYFGFGGTGFPVTQTDQSVEVVPLTDSAQGPIARNNITPAYGGMSPLPDGYAGPSDLGSLCAVGSSFNCGFDPVPALSVPLMWQMRANPVIALVSFTLVIAPILTAGQSIEIVDDTGDEKQAAEIKRTAEKFLLPTFARALPGACESLHFANWLQEIVWGRREDRAAPGNQTDSAVNGSTKTLVVPMQPRPILPMEAMIHRNAGLQFVGFQIGDEYRDARYGFLCVNQPHLDPVRGYSRNQNALNSWWRAAQSERNADRIERKASGIHMMLGVGTGNYISTDAQGNKTTITAQQMAQSVANQAAAGNVFTVPQMFFAKESIENNPELAKVRAVTVDKFDWGNIGEALSAHLERLERLDRAMIRAWYHGEREAIEGVHGTKAEAGVHKAGGVLDCELTHSSICQQWDDQQTRYFVEQNYGQQWVGCIRTKPNPLSDPMQEFLQEVTKTLLNSDEDAKLEVDKRQMMERTKIPLRPVEDVVKDRKEREAQKPQFGDTPINGKANGNGKLDPRVSDAVTNMALKGMKASRRRMMR